MIDEFFHCKTEVKINKNDRKETPVAMNDSLVRERKSKK